MLLLCAVASEARHFVHMSRQTRTPPRNLPTRSSRGAEALPAPLCDCCQAVLCSSTLGSEGVSRPA
eukprot:5189261-Amphidinium_carterae.1